MATEVSETDMHHRYLLAHFARSTCFLVVDNPFEAEHWICLASRQNDSGREGRGKHRRLAAWRHSQGPKCGARALALFRRLSLQKNAFKGLDAK